MMRRFICFIAMLNLASLPAFARPGTDGWSEETCDVRTSTEVFEDNSSSELALCRMLAYDREDTRAAFCRSQPDAGVRGRCWAHYKKSAIAWLGWCRNEFSY